MPSKATKKRRQQQKAQAQAARQIAGEPISNLDQPSTSRQLPEMKPDSEQKTEIEKTFKKMTLSEKQYAKMKLVPKPSRSLKGKEISLICNHFMLAISLPEIYHYDVKIEIINTSTTLEDHEKMEKNIEKVTESGKDKIGKFRCYNTKLNRKIIDEFSLKENSPFHNNMYVFDGKKNIYTVRPLMLDQNSYTISIQDDFDRERNIKITIIEAVKENGTNRINLESINSFYRKTVNDIPQECSMALETILRNEPAYNHYPIRRCFYPYNSITTELPGGRLLRDGFHQSVIFTQCGPILNVNLSASTFFSPNNLIIFLEQLLKMIKEEKNIRNSEIDLNKILCLEKEQIIRLNQELNGARIFATHFNPPRKYRIYGISTQSANEIIFDFNGKNTNITDYFLKQYKIPLKYGRFPCVKINKNRDLFLPLELCQLPEGEPCRRKPSSLQTSEMIAKTAVPPKNRFRSIENYINQNFSNTLHTFNINIDNKPVELTGRVLDAPQIKYSSKSTIPKQGQWNLLGNTFLEGRSINKWSVLNFSTKNIDFQKFFNIFCKAGMKFGLTIKDCSDIKYVLKERNKPLNDYLRDMKNQELVLVVLTSKNDDRYDKIKYFSETEIGIVTQCVVDSKLIRCDEQYCANLCQKINTKLGGKNTCLDIKELPELLNESKRIMIIGVDCNHPGANDDLKYTVAAAVCNIDSQMFNYTATWTIQERTKDEENKKTEDEGKKKTKGKQIIEIIIKFKEMAKKLLSVYQSENKDLPKMIIYYRDGVSEGQYEQVLNEEVNQLRKACDEIKTGYKPPISCIIVNKSHHTRFMEGKKQENIPPGTNVDNTVVHYQNFDFYLCSQKGLKGTSKPAHYTVICDDNYYFYSNPDILHKFTYYLCYLSARCTRSLSLPVPVYYADLCAYRIKKYLLALKSIHNIKDKNEFLARVNQINVVPKLANGMFFV